MIAGERVIHMAPPAKRVSILMQDLFGWLAATDDHPLIASSVFHYEFEFITPFRRRQQSYGPFVADSYFEPLESFVCRYSGRKSDL